MGRIWPGSNKKGNTDTAEPTKPSKDLAWQQEKPPSPAEPETQEELKATTEVISAKAEAEPSNSATVAATSTKDSGDTTMRNDKSEMNKPNPTSLNSDFSSPSEAQNSPSSPTAVIGPKIRFKGELAGEEDLIIQGQVDGTIDLKDNHLTVGGQGTVKANVLAKTVTIEGNVEGDIFGQERISILSSSNVKGNIVASRVILEDGAKFRGSIDMDIESHQKEFQRITQTNTAPQPSAPAAPKAPAAPMDTNTTGKAKDSE